MAALNPLETLELSSGSKPKWIHLNYHLIRRGGGDSNHMLVVMEDISEAKSLEEEVIRSQQENLQLKAIVEEPELFREFIAEAKTMVASARRLASSLMQQDSARRESAEIFRLIHTIKGIAGAFALRHITGLAGKVEECLSSMRNHVTPQTLAVLHDYLSMLEQAREAQTLTPAECYNLILKPGFTTKSEVTDVSGRGVGLDVVVHSVKNKLNGQIQIESQVGIKSGGFYRNCSLNSTVSKNSRAWYSVFVSPWKWQYAAKRRVMRRASVAERCAMASSSAQSSVNFSAGSSPAGTILRRSFCPTQVSQAKPPFSITI